MKPMNVERELRRIVRTALEVVGGTGGRRHCQYCGRESYPGQIEHWRVGVKSVHEGCDTETDEHCVVTVAKAALKKLAPPETTP